MYLKSFFLLQLTIASWANTIDVIRDYFLFKEVTTLAGFSCAEFENDYQMIKVLNDVGISVSIKQIESNVNISQALQTDYWKIGVLIDLRCPLADKNIRKIFDEVKSIYLIIQGSTYISIVVIPRTGGTREKPASASFLFQHLHQWLILENSMDHITKLVNDSTFSIITDFVISLPRDDDYVLYDVYNHCKHCGGSLNIIPFGVWTRNDGLNITLLENKFSRRRNFHRLHAKCGGLVIPQNITRKLEDFLTEKTTNSEDNWAKFGYALMVHVAYMFNYTLDVLGLMHWDANKYNGPLFTGFQDGSIDIGYFPSVITQQRIDIADAILQVFPARIKLFVGFPNDNNRQLSSRVAFFQTMIFGLIIYNCYSAAIVSSRLNNVPIERMNDSLMSLARSGFELATHNTLTFHIILSVKSLIFIGNNYTGCIEICVYNIRGEFSQENHGWQMFRHKNGHKIDRCLQDVVCYLCISDYPIPEGEHVQFKKYWDAIPDEKKFLPVREGIRRIMTPGFAYHTDPNNAYPLIERWFTNEMISQLTEVHLLQPSALSLWSAKYGQFREVAKIGLIRLYTAGIRKREILRWVARKPFYNEIGQSISSVSIIEIAPIIILLLFGVVLSIVICILENIVYWKLQAKQQIVQVSKQKKYYNNKVVMKKIGIIQTFNGMRNEALQHKNLYVD
ncbi:ionotropic receptor 75a [Calliopsis andreniformis]|uniref:ionotropic receptor 75a n=1 Tax=Calliopsis andreniformis TaxID=337506 RepID=UPI003FCE968C